MLSIAEKEIIRKRQEEGIAAAKARGVVFGRPHVEVPEYFGQIVEAWETKDITFDVALKLSGLKEATFYRRLREYREAAGRNRR